MAIRKCYRYSSAPQLMFINPRLTSRDYTIKYIHHRLKCIHMLLMLMCLLALVLSRIRDSSPVLIQKLIDLDNTVHFITYISVLCRLMNPSHISGECPLFAHSLHQPPNKRKISVKTKSLSVCVCVKWVRVSICPLDCLYLSLLLSAFLTDKNRPCWTSVRHSIEQDEKIVCDDYPAIDSNLWAYTADVRSTLGSALYPPFASERGRGKIGTGTFGLEQKKENKRKQSTT